MTVDLPSGREILPPDAPRADWLAERRNGIGGSDVPLLLGVAPPSHGSLYELWLDKTGRAGPDPGPTGAMIRGTWLEPPLIEWFAKQTGLDTAPVGLCQWNGDPLVRATPDTATSDGGLAEIKSIGQFANIRHEWRRGGVARGPYAQLQTEMLVTGRAPGYLVAYEIDREPMLRGPFGHDHELQRRIVAAIRAFWHTHVIPDVAPEPDPTTITDDEIRLRWPRNVGDAVEALYPAYVRQMLAERAECHDAETTGKKRKSEIDTALRVMTADHAALTIDGVPVVTFSERDTGPRVAPEMEWEQPEMWRQYVTRGTARAINIVKGRSDGR